MIDYVPFMDQCPKLKLKPVTEFADHLKIQGFDYVQDLRFSGSKAFHGCFYLIVKNGQFGIYMYDRHWLFDNIASVVLHPEYEAIDFIWFKDRSVGVIVKRNEKYGMFFWTYGYFENEKLSIVPEFDAIEVINNSRLRAIKNNTITYYGFSGHVLK